MSQWNDRQQARLRLLEREEIYTDLRRYDARKIFDKVCRDLPKDPNEVMNKLKSSEWYKAEPAPGGVGVISVPEIAAREKRLFSDNARSLDPNFESFMRPIEAMDGKVHTYYIGHFCLIAPKQVPQTIVEFERDGGKLKGTDPAPVEELPEDENDGPRNSPAR